MSLASRHGDTWKAVVLKAYRFAARVARGERFDVPIAIRVTDRQFVQFAGSLQDQGADGALTDKQFKGPQALLEITAQLSKTVFAKATTPLVRRGWVPRSSTT